MSNREFAKALIDQISEAKLIYVIPYLQGAALSDEVPNQRRRTVSRQNRYTLGVIKNVITSPSLL